MRQAGRRPRQDMNGRIHSPHGHASHQHLLDLFNPRAIPPAKRRLASIAALLLLCVVVTAARLSLLSPSVSNETIVYYDDEDGSVLGSDPVVSASLARGETFADRDHCQIVYILGAEGSFHHGFTPIMQKLAARQTDPATGAPLAVSYPNGHFRRGIFGHHNETRTLDDPDLIARTLRYICPADGARHVTIEDTSFPSGYQFDIRTYRIHRMPWWATATMEEIAMADTALNHPTNLDVFYKLYSPYADIKFVVIHRSYVEMIGSHYEFDDTVERHSNVIRGFLLLLRRFLDSHPTDPFTGGRLWTLVCAEHLKVQESEEETDFSRRNILRYLVEFLGWSNEECPECFDHWKTSSKNHVGQLGQEGIAVVLEHMKKLGGIWPPTIDSASREQKCIL